MATPRPIRFCDVCGGLDDHPRHVINTGRLEVDTTPSREFLDSLAPGAPVAAIAELTKQGVLVRHLDCCAAQGCAVCGGTEALTAGARGQELIEAIEGGALDGFQAPAIVDNKELGIHG